MAINAYGQDIATNGVAPVASTLPKDKTSLSNDDFMTLLLVELQNQDPTSPTDTATILTQTSQLASLESSDNTNTALSDLSTSLSASSDFSAISIIGKTADLGSNAISSTKGEDTTFDLYFPSDVASGNVTILDSNGNVLKTISADTGDSGVYTYSWDGTDTAGNQVDEGIYYVTASYTDASGKDLTTRLGTYPIESIKFDKGATYAKVASGYVALEDISEIY